MKKKVLIVAVLVLMVLVLFFLANTVCLCHGGCCSGKFDEEWGWPVTYFRVKFSDDGSTVIAKPESWGFAFYLTVPIFVGFWAGRKWPKKEKNL